VRLLVHKLISRLEAIGFDLLELLVALRRPGLLLHLVVVCLLSCMHLLLVLLQSLSLSFMADHGDTVIWRVHRGSNNLGSCPGSGVIYVRHFLLSYQGLSLLGTAGL